MFHEFKQSIGMRRSREKGEREGGRVSETGRVRQRCRHTEDGVIPQNRGELLERRMRV